MATTNPLQFIQQVRAEVVQSRLADPSRGDADHGHGVYHGGSDGGILCDG